MKTKCKLCSADSPKNIPFKTGHICEECKNYIKLLPSAIKPDKPAD